MGGAEVGEPERGAEGKEDLPRTEDGAKVMLGGA